MPAARPLALLLLLAAASQAAPLSGWSQGVAKSWGGPQDGLDPNQVRAGSWWQLTKPGLLLCPQLCHRT